MADQKPPGSTPGAEPGLDDLDPSILEAVGQANAEIKAAVGNAPPKPAPAEAAAGASLDQGGIDDLLNQASFDDPEAASQSAAADAELEQVLVGAESKASMAGGAGSARPAVPKFDLPAFGGGGGGGVGMEPSSIDLLRDVELNVKIELGRSRMLVEDVLKLAEGSVVELDKLAGDPVDVFVNDRLVARGEVLVLNDNFCVRVNEIVAGVRDDGL